ncbi:Prefoldin, subunit 3 [Tilletiaria anomala UBC 951]|uniref:Prefoldin, subunit 3 n=1 Tax=Tilletiaria anomala (strain ATCC 24038 / CBS 436.72 / UBC 951) TaxID=1037660 RepID=A0A066W2P7_TILAU|nr:Prefoldin, subunit 3 [Tilletiaria anomala UBC 951]KDN47996.1 Prefoldin, subunit 3 [Tilletiaria anomala UBC 951]
MSSGPSAPTSSSPAAATVAVRQEASASSSLPSSSSSSNGLAKETQDQSANTSGIPTAPFITDVEEFLGGPDEPVASTLRKFQETVSKYKFMEVNTAQRKTVLEQKIPDIRDTLRMVEFLKLRKDDPNPVDTTFELNDTLYARATLENVETVNLWLGANVMLTYPIEEAITLLSAKLSGAEKSLQGAKADLEFLRDQITTMEVNTARVHNWDVKRRREKRLQDAKEAAVEKGQGR